MGLFSVKSACIISIGDGEIRTTCKSEHDKNGNKHSVYVWLEIVSILILCGR